MSHSMIFTRSVQCGGDAAISAQVTVTSGTRIAIDESVPQSAATLLPCLVDVSQMKGLFIKSDVAVILKTNSSSAPDNTITIPAGGVVAWANGDAVANPLTVDVASGIYAVLGAVGTGRIQIEILIDPTV